jgi:3-deoxy-D-manno-octulosonic acid kinase
VSGSELPAGYAPVRADRVTGFAWLGAASWLRSALAQGETLYDWASHRARDIHAGRGPVHVVDAPVPGPAGAARWVVRHYRRGGAAAPLLGDRYWGGRARPELELAASAHLRAAGVRTPAVVAGAVYREGMEGVLGFYRADLVTEHVPHARTLAATLLQDDADLVGALASTGALARDVAHAGVVHADFNASNVLVDRSGDPWVLDLDRARRLAGPSPRAGHRMVSRLERSLRKLEQAHGRYLTSLQWSALHGALDVP